MCFVCFFVFWCALWSFSPPDQEISWYATVQHVVPTLSTGVKLVCHISFFMSFNRKIRSVIKAQAIVCRSNFIFILEISITAITQFCSASCFFVLFRWFSLLVELSLPFCSCFFNSIFLKYGRTDFSAWCFNGLICRAWVVCREKHCREEQY